MSSEDIVNFQSSKLGTKEYWDDCYELENENFDDHGEEGEVWFGEEAGERMVDWLEERCQEGELSESSPVLDVGCGNGLLTVSLCQAGWTNVTGVDYSSGAVELATKIASQYECTATFQTMDLLDNDLVSSNFGGQFRIIVDKGTFDAVSLSEGSTTEKQKYVESLAVMLEAEGLFLITSCNWTETELSTHFASHFSLLETVPTPTFTFGGRTGKTTTFCIFQKK